MNDNVIERTILIAAPRERVWEALTDPKMVEQWFSPGTSWETVGQGVGARLFVRNKETGEEMYTQVITVFDPPSRLVNSSVPATPGAQPQLTSFTLEEEDGGTRLTLVYSGLESMDEESRRRFIEQSGTGFELMLGNIRAVLEGTPLPMPGGF